MKKYLGMFSVFAIALFISAQAVHAEDVLGVSAGADANTSVTTGNTSTNADARLNMQTTIKTDRAAAQVKIDALKSSIKNERDTTKANIEEARLNVRINALQKFDAAVGRMTDLKGKVSAEITALGAKGVDVTTATSDEATAELDINNANAKIVQINTLLSVSVTALTADNKATLKTLSKDTETLLQDAHKSLNDAIKSLRDGIKVKIDAKANASAQTGTTTQTNE